MWAILTPIQLIALGAKAIFEPSISRSRVCNGQTASKRRECQVQRQGELPRWNLFRSELLDAVIPAKAESEL